MAGDRDRELARDYLFATWCDYDEPDAASVDTLADLLASVRREGEARALAHLRKHWSAYSVIGVAVDEAERALASKDRCEAHDLPMPCGECKAFPGSAKGQVDRG